MHLLIFQDSTTAGRPCEPGFLQALINDIFILTHLSSHKILRIKSIHIDQPLPKDVGTIARNLCAVMRQCRRLKSAPELFPSVEAKNEFLKMMSKVMPIMSIIPISTSTKHTIESHYFWTRIFEVNSKSVIPHPNTPYNRNPWNNWLDNSADPRPGWISLQQKIPRYGDKLMKRITLEYNAIEADFRLVCLTLRRRRCCHMNQN